MSAAVPSGSGGPAPTRSEVEGWPIQHLDDVAAHLRRLGGQSVRVFEQHRQNIAAPGGTTWEGDAKDAALDRALSDIAVVRLQSDVQAEAAAVAENGGHDVRAAKRAALEAISEAEGDGFRVGEDLSVSDTREVDPATMAARRTAAIEHAEDIRWTTEQLVQTDRLVGRRLQNKAVELEGIRFDGEPSVQLVDNEIGFGPTENTAEVGKSEPDSKPGTTQGQIGPFPVPRSVEEATKTPYAKPEGMAPGAGSVGGGLEDLLNPEEAPPGEHGDEKPGGLPEVLSPTPPPSALDTILAQHTGNGEAKDGRYTRSPLAAPIVGADPSVLDRQAVRVDGARQTLDAAQAELDAAAGQTYTHGAGAGPGHDVTDPLSHVVFDARRELTEQSAILDDLNQAAAESGGQPSPIPALPENVDVQSFPPEPSTFVEGSRALSEGSLGFIPDVAKDIDVFTNWGEHSVADRTQAVLDAAGMVPLPGVKPLAEGVDYGLDALAGVSRHFDDGPTPHAQVEDVPSGGHGVTDVVPHHAADAPGTNHVGGDTGSVVPFGIEDTAALLTTSESAGGHLLERHVAQTPGDLAARLETTRLQEVSTFTSADEAASAVSTALQRNQEAIDNWLTNGAVRYLELDAPFSGGAILERGSAETVAGTGVRVVLKGDGQGGWYVLTGFPRP
ncbi:RNase A-like domain-containing protein [Mycolicibacterium arenosum]|uniref:Bacterial CdiA-CT RNAse A domain-containing protein n=1 Tax=Mycolicibacterium arenosum TaxID=2952157 RepID=A0ABT1M4C3_9MYCO|nr:RNase A-like domain-containing protein [Mycolicibacterium sp. CAU 1645]MCP9274015.1 hypothetical protein [Mycolicibacterium sp. CAU 1645]